MSGKQNNTVSRYHLLDIVNTVYLIYIMAVYPIYMDELYFNITKTRALVFIEGTIFYIIIAVAAFFLDTAFSGDSLGKGSVIRKHQLKPFFMEPSVWIVLFVMANVLAWINSPDKAGSMSGETGRYMGLGMMLVAAVMFLVLSRRCMLDRRLIIILSLVILFTTAVAVLQHFGFDPFYWRENVAEKQKELFISTFGNINTYGSFLAIILPLLSAVFIFSRLTWIRILSAVTLFAASFGVLPAKSDNVYIGAAAGLIVIFYIAVIEKRLTAFLEACFMIVLGLFLMSVINKALNGSQKHINGLARIIENPKVMIIFVIVFCTISIICIILEKYKTEAFYRIQSGKSLVVITILGVLCVTAIVIAGLKSGSELFIFNDKWGTFRGYIWRRGISLFKAGNVSEKLFGYGNETILSLMNENYHDEMLQVTNRTYDNLHCELLQYLVTTGIFGAASYVGFFISGMVYMFKIARGNAAVLALAAAATGYIAQGLVSITQPITGPMYFVIMAAGIGYARCTKSQYTTGITKGV